MGLHCMLMSIMELKILFFCVWYQFFYSMGICNGFAHGSPIHGLYALALPCLPLCLPVILKVLKQRKNLKGISSSLGELFENTRILGELWEHWNTFILDKNTGTLGEFVLNENTGMLFILNENTGTLGELFSMKTREH